VNTVFADNNVWIVGWLFYDGECHLCCESARCVERLLARRRFRLCTLQSPDASQRLGLSGGPLLREMRLLLADGRNLGGADAVVEIARRIWWAWPLWLFSRVPGVQPLLHAVYRAIAANRHCIGGACKIPRRHRHSAFFELP
jgi:predicted DCC family thiol-disulfide oxidoreductase YuxK